MKCYQPSASACSELLESRMRIMPAKLCEIPCRYYLGNSLVVPLPKDNVTLPDMTNMRARQFWKCVRMLSENCQL